MFMIVTCTKATTKYLDCQKISVTIRILVDHSHKRELLHASKVNDPCFPDRMACGNMCPPQVLASAQSIRRLRSYCFRPSV